MSSKNHHPVVCFGETFWNSLPGGRQAVGALLNVAYHLQMLGQNPALISRIGYDDSGKQLIETLEAKNICTDYFQMDDTKATGTLTCAVNKSDEAICHFHDDAAWDNIEYTDELFDLVSNADYLIFGSLASRFKTTHQTLMQLLPAAKEKVLDLNLCSPFYRRYTIETLLKEADIVKFTLDELELVTGWFSDYKQKTDRIKMVSERFSISTIIVTRCKPGVIISKDDKFYKHSGFEVKSKYNSESNDAFLAGWLTKISQGASADEALEYANALDALVTNNYTDAWPSYKPEEIELMLRS